MSTHRSRPPRPTARLVAVALAAALAISATPGHAQLQASGAIELPGTAGRLDHLAIDVARGHLFVAALEANATEVIDINAGKRIARLDRQHEPQGLAYLATANRLLVANGASGTVEAFTDEKRVGAVDGLADADNLRLDTATGRLYVGYGSGLATVDPLTLRILERIALPGHPEAFELSTSTPAVYVNVPSAGQVVVLDRRNGKTTAAWDVAPASGNFPMALDEREHRLFVATRSPPTLQVYDVATGRRVVELPVSGDPDDLFFDAGRRQLYVVCGEGRIDVFRQRDANHYEATQRLPTSAGARTGLFVPSLETLFVAAPARGGRTAEILVFRVQSRRRRSRCSRTAAFRPPVRDLRCRRRVGSTPPVRRSDGAEAAVQPGLLRSGHL